MMDTSTTTILVILSLFVWALGVPVVAYGCGVISRRWPKWEINLWQIHIVALFWPMIIVMLPFVVLMISIEKIYNLGLKPTNSG